MSNRALQQQMFAKNRRIQQSKPKRKNQGEEKHVTMATDQVKNKIHHGEGSEQLIGQI